MILQVTEQGLNLGEPEDLKSYSVRINHPERSADSIAALHPELRSVDPARLAVGQATLLRLAGKLALDQEWLSDFDGMVKYAGAKGWVTEAGEIIGHIECYGMENDQYTPPQ